MTKSEREHIQQKRQAEMNARRRFLIISGATVAAIAAGELTRRYGLPLISNSTDQEPASDNLELVRELEELMGINKKMDRVSVSRHTFQEFKLADPQWMRNVTLRNGILNNRGQTITFGFQADGSPRYDNVNYNPVKLNYPGSNLARSHLQHGNNFIAVYGTERTVGQVLTDRLDLSNFLSEYFGDSNAKTNVLHVNFNPTDKPPELLQLGTEFFRDNGTAPDHRIQSISENQAQIYSHEVIIGTTQISNFRMDRYDIVLNLDSSHVAANAIGFNLEPWMRGVMSNEMQNLLENDKETQFKNEQTELIVDPNQKLAIARSIGASTDNEASSTAIGQLANLDEDWAEIVMGGLAYKDFIGVITSEMKRLAEN